MKNMVSTNEISEFNYDGNDSNLYYELANKGNESFPKHVAFKNIIKYLKKSDSICEFGCGDGSKIIHFRPFTNDLTGFDLSTNAINKAKKLLPNAKFYDKDMSEVFKEASFDVTMTFYALEHVQNPENFINNMIRTTKPGGYIIGICPNFGSPLFPSPPELLRAGNFIGKLALIFKRMFEYKQYYSNSISKNVIPITHLPFQPDYDTVSEISLASIVQKYKDYLVESSSFWKVELKFIIFFPYIIFVILGLIGITPIKYWGPICFFVLQKRPR